MFAIQAEDSLSEEIVVLPTLAADDVAAMTLMTAKAEIWTQKQPSFKPVDFAVHQDFQLNSVTVFLKDRVVYELTAWPITAMIDSTELTTFLKPKSNGSLN